MSNLNHNDFNISPEKWKIIRKIFKGNFDCDEEKEENKQKIKDMRPFQRKITDFIPK